MKNIFKILSPLCAIALVAVIGFGLASCDNGGGQETPVTPPGGGDMTWTLVADPLFVATPLADVIYAIAYGGSAGQEKFIAGGGRMAYSADGITWTAVADSTFGTYNINAIAYGGSAGQEKFVAAGRYGKMAYSADGVNWTAVSSTFGTLGIDILAIAYGNGTFVAGGGGGKMAYSADGVTWTPVGDSGMYYYNYNEQQLQHGTFKATINAIAFGNNKFVAGGGAGSRAYSADGAMAYSADGVNWTAVADTGMYDYSDNYGALKDSINAIAFGNNKFVAGGERGTMAFSSDGVTWTSTFDDVNYNIRYNIRAIAYGNGTFVAGDIYSIFKGN